MEDSRKEMILLATSLLVITIIMWVGFVKPYNDWINDMIDCTGPDNSREAYEECREKLQKSQSL